MAYPLAGKIAVVTGASRGLGKGVALGLGEAGATVYVTGRTMVPQAGAVPGSIPETATEVTERGGHGIAVRCDHRIDSEVEALFRRVEQEQGRLDILVNNVYPVPALPAHIPRSHSGRTPVNTPFWEIPISYFDELLAGSLRAHYVASWFAAPLMKNQGHGLIVNISSSGAVCYSMNAPHGVEKAAFHRLTQDTAHELELYKVAVVELFAPFTKTESSLTMAAKFGTDYSGAYSPLFTGRAVAALAADPHILERTGTAVVATELAEQYGFVDSDGAPSGA
jgi:dehydrogenase/reductase SDR family member 1